MKKNIYLLILIAASIKLSAQAYMPGGVDGAVLWDQGQLEKEKAFKFASVLVQPKYTFSATKSQKHYLLNQNPSLYLEEGAFLELKYKASDLERMTFFTVYQIQDTLKERNVWSVFGDSSNLVLTTHRLADLSEGKYLNFFKGKQKTAEIHAYYQHKKENSSSDYLLKIGSNSLSTSLPISNFGGIVPEVIIYDRVLSNKERQQVETYLAIKYGIPIYQGEEPKDYLDSQGEVIWSGKDNKKFNLHVAGVGVDHKSGLTQYTSSSSLEPELFSLSYLKTENLRDRSFIIWGDNGKSWSIKKLEQGSPKAIERLWKLQLTDLTSDFEIKIDKGLIKDSLKMGEHYWLSVDKSGSGDFPKGETEYIKLEEKQTDRFLNIQGNSFSELKGSMVLGLRRAADFFAEAWLEEPSCDGQTKGALSFKAHGGLPPYKVTLISLKQKNIHYLDLNATEINSIKNLSPDTYSYTIEDALGATYREDISLESFDAPKSNLKSDYTLVEGKRLYLNAKLEDGDYSYRWTDSSDKLLSTAWDINLDKAGIYSLQITDSNGCYSTKKIEIMGQSPDNFKAVALFPNPSFGGDFYIKISLLRVADVGLKIFDLSGRLLQNEVLKSKDYYLYKGKISTQGAYYIQLESEGVSKTLKLLVN